MPEDSNSWYIGPASSQKREGHLIVRKVPVNPPPPTAGIGLRNKNHL